MQSDDCYSNFKNAFGAGNVGSIPAPLPIIKIKIMIYIYIIKNKIDNKCYIGSTSNYKKRVSQHKNSLLKR